MPTGGGDSPPYINPHLTKSNLNQLYVIGGDGTHRGASAISQEIARRQVPEGGGWRVEGGGWRVEGGGLISTCQLGIAVVGVPKTIDNDIAFIDKSFGFETAVSEAVKVINCALVEAQDCEQGCVSMCVRMWACMWLRLRVCMYVYVCGHVCGHVCGCVWVHIYSDSRYTITQRPNSNQ